MRFCFSFYVTRETFNFPVTGLLGVTKINYFHKKCFTGNISYVPMYKNNSKEHDVSRETSCSLELFLYIGT